MRYKSELKNLAQKINQEFNTMEAGGKSKQEKVSNIESGWKKVESEKSGLRATEVPTLTNKKFKSKSQAKSHVPNEFKDDEFLKKMIGTMQTTQRQIRVQRYLGEVDRLEKIKSQKEEETKLLTMNESRRRVTRLFTGIWKSINIRNNK